MYETIVSPSMVHTTLPFPLKDLLTTDRSDCLHNSRIRDQDDGRSVHQTPIKELKGFVVDQVNVTPTIINECQNIRNRKFFNVLGERKGDGRGKGKRQ